MTAKCPLGCCPFPFSASFFFSPSPFQVGVPVTLKAFPELWPRAGHWGLEGIQAPCLPSRSLRSRGGRPTSNKGSGQATGLAEGAGWPGPTSEGGTLGLATMLSQDLNRGVGRRDPRWWDGEGPYCLLPSISPIHAMRVMQKRRAPEPSVGRVPLGLAPEQSLPPCISLILKMSGVYREERGQYVCVWGGGAQCSTDQLVLFRVKLGRGFLATLNLPGLLDPR